MHDSAQTWNRIHVLSTSFIFASYRIVVVREWVALRMIRSMARSAHDPPSVIVENSILLSTSGVRL
jgi:hypothetical protein